MAIHFSIPAWEIPWTEESRGLQSIGLHRVGHDCRDLACTHATTKTQRRKEGTDAMSGMVCGMGLCSYCLVSRVRLSCDPMDYSPPGSM